MERDAAIARLKTHDAELKQLGVQSLHLFGATARGEARDDSDINLFFGSEKEKFGRFELMDVKERTFGILGRKADIIICDSLHRTLKSGIEAWAVRIF